MITTTDVSIDKFLTVYGFGWAVGEPQDPVGTCAGTVWDDRSEAEEYRNTHGLLCSDGVVFGCLYRHDRTAIIRLEDAEAYNLVSSLRSMAGARWVIASLVNDGSVNAADAVAP